MAEVTENPEKQTDLESTKIAPETWKTPEEPDEVISRSSLEDGSKDLELCWVGTALEDGSKLASWVRSESRCLDLTKMGCAEAVARTMSWEGFQDLQKIGIKDPPDVDENHDAPEQNRIKIQKNLDEQLKLVIMERMDSAKDGRKGNSHGETKSQMDFEKMAGEGTPPEMKNSKGTEFVDIQKFLDRLRGELIADCSSQSPCRVEPESTFPEIELENPDSRTPGTPTSKWGELRIPESLTTGKVRPGWNWKMKSPESLMDPLDSLTVVDGCKEPLESLMAEWNRPRWRLRCQIDGGGWTSFQESDRGRKNWLTSHFGPPPPPGVSRAKNDALVPRTAAKERPKVIER